MITEEQLKATADNTLKEVAEQFNCSRATVGRLRKKYKIATTLGRRPTIQARECPTCKMNFKPVTDARLYCSSKCYHESMVGKEWTEEMRSVISQGLKRAWEDPSDAMLAAIEGRKKDDVETFRQYRNKLKRLTEQTYDEFKHDINPNGYIRAVAGVDGAYHLDHIIPARFGFDNGIPEEELARKDNLQMLPWRDNIVKGSKHESAI